LLFNKSKKEKLPKSAVPDLLGKKKKKGGGEKKEKGNKKKNN